MLQANSRSRRQGPLRRRRVPGTRAHQACLNCKEKKLKCDDQNPACGNCKRLAIACLIQDPKSKKTRPRNYLEVLEGRVASLEGRDDRSSSGTTQSPLGPVGGCSNGSTPSTQLTPDNGEGTSDLSSRVGMLDFRTTQMEPQYLGSSSAFAFSRIINFSLSRDLPSEPTLASLNNRHASPPSPCLLPDYEVALTLSNAYFKHIHPQYPFLHEPTFRAWEARHYGSSHDVSEIGFSSSPLFFLNMVYAVASLLLPNTQSLAEQLYMSAQLFTDILSKDNLESIQALLCYAMYSLRSMDGPSLWKLSGLALRQCIELGYHRGIKRLAPTANPLQQEMRRRVFWVANGIDCTVALRLGRPLGIPIQEIDAEYPSDVDDSAITEAGITSPPRSHHSQPATTMSTAIHVFKLRHIWAQIHTSLFSGASRSDVEHGACHPRIGELRADLDTWLAEAPPSRPRQDDDLSIFSISTWYELNYSYTMMLLYRGQLAEYKESNKQVFEECIQASRNICQSYRRLYIGTAVRYTWGTLHCLFLSGLTYLHCLWTYPTVLESVRPEDVSKTCTDCTMVLVAIAEGWQSAAPYRDTFEALANRTIAMVINKSRSAPSPAPPLGEVELGDDDNWSHWLTDMAEAGVLDGVDGLLAGFISDFATHPDY
ncbi:hypothetical protein FALCPG4_017529 [Fusarium falciforme]